MMHLLGLIRMEYVNSPEKGQYLITERGKKAIGVQETSKEKALAILSYSPHDKAFNFYLSLGKPLNLHAHNLKDFANKLYRADAASVNFHLQRGDFESWFKGLGDAKLAKKTVLLKQRNFVGEDLRKRLTDIVEQRYLELTELAGQSNPNE